MVQPTNLQWRQVEGLKMLRQCVICPTCGSMVTTEAGINAHLGWHDEINTYVQNVSNQFQGIDDYVRGDGGLEDQIVARFVSTDAVIAQLRTDATNAINLLRADATAAIVSLQNRVTALENA